MNQLEERKMEHQTLELNWDRVARMVSNELSRKVKPWFEELKKEMKDMREGLYGSIDSKLRAVNARKRSDRPRDISSRISHFTKHDTKESSQRTDPSDDYFLQRTMRANQRAMDEVLSTSAAKDSLVIITPISLVDSESSDLSAMPESNSGCFTTIKNVIPTDYDVKKSNSTLSKSIVMNNLITDAFESAKLRRKPKKCVSTSTLHPIIKRPCVPAVAQSIINLESYVRSQESAIDHDLSTCVSSVASFESSDTFTECTFYPQLSSIVLNDSECTTSSQEHELTATINLTRNQVIEEERKIYSAQEVILTSTQNLDVFNDSTVSMADIDNVYTYNLYPLFNSLFYTLFTSVRDEAYDFSTQMCAGETVLNMVKFWCKFSAVRMVFLWWIFGYFDFHEARVFQPLFTIISKCSMMILLFIYQHYTYSDVQKWTMFYDQMERIFSNVFYSYFGSMTFMMFKPLWRLRDVIVQIMLMWWIEGFYTSM
jgi:hypothetical protein